MPDLLTRSIDSVINLYTVLEPEKKLIYVEGKQDYQFYSTHIKELGNNVSFSEINTVDFSSLWLSFPSNLERNNNRDKIIYLIEEIHKKNAKSQIFGIIDRDILEYTRKLSELDSNILLTDYGCLEVYYLNKSNIKKLLQTYSEKITEDIIDKSYIAAAMATLLIIFEKKNKIGIPKISLSSYLKLPNIKFNFDNYTKNILINYKKDKSIDLEKSTQELYAIQKSLESTNPKNYLNGHYFMEILLCYLKSVEKKRFQHTTQEQIEDIFRVSVETSFISNEALFQKLLII